MSNQTLVIREISTIPLKVEFDNDALKGFITADAVIMSKPQIKQLMDQVETGEIEDDEILVRKLYKDFHGLPMSGEEAWEFVLRGPYSNYILSTLVRRYFEHYGEARKGNSLGRRAR